MLFSSASIHPSMHTSFVLKTAKSPLTPSRKASRISPPGTPFGGPSREIFLLSMLQGVESICCDRVRIEAEISDLCEKDKQDLIEFLSSQNGAACAAVENNACKQLTCASSQFCEAFCDEECSLKLLDLWEKLYKEIIPAMEDILFPLSQYDADFNIRLTVMRFFRDRVLMKCLEPVDFRLPEIEPILFTLLLETNDDSEEYIAFVKLSDRLMGAEEQIECPTKTVHCYSSVSLRKSSSTEQIKCRSKTLPNKRKSVQWEDMRKSKTVSNF